MTQDERDKNLLVVVAVEQYAVKHNMSEANTLELFKEYGISDLIRKNYEALHTQRLEESYCFAEDILKRKITG